MWHSGVHTLAPKLDHKKFTFPSLFTVQPELINYIQWPRSLSYKRQGLGSLKTMDAFASFGTDSSGEILSLFSRVILAQHQAPSGFQLIAMSSARVPVLHSRIPGQNNAVVMCREASIRKVSSQSKSWWLVLDGIPRHTVLIALVFTIALIAEHTAVRHTERR